MNKVDQFIALFEVPPAIQPHVDVFADPGEIDLIVSMNGETLAVDQVADRLNLTDEQARAFLEASYRRHFVHREVDGRKVGYIFEHESVEEKTVRYIPARFTDRLDELTMYGNWDQIPDEVRREITDWWLRDYVEKIAPVVEKIKRDPDAYQQIKQKDFLLLEEALAQVESASVHAVVNCDCRCSTQGCNRMLETCIRLDDGARYTLERGLGRAVTKAACKQIVLETDREGLMHIGTLPHGGRGLFGFCNCCTCCCFPLRASTLLGSDRVYPRVHHVAVKNERACTQCGICVKRCPFEAFHHDGQMVAVTIRGRKKTAEHVAFDPSRCYGCGLCQSACPQGCIEMKPLQAC